LIDKNAAIKKQITLVVSWPVLLAGGLLSVSQLGKKGYDKNSRRAITPRSAKLN
jgi:hypothetical protein